MRRISMLVLASVVMLAATLADAQERKQIVIKNGKVLEGNEDIVVLHPGERFASRAFLGVSTMSLSEELRAHFGTPKDAGVLISTVSAESPAAKAGLRAGDVITAIDGKKVDSSASIVRALREKQKGDQVRVDFRRNGANQQVFATLAEREGFDIPEIRLNREMIREPLVIAGEAVKDIEAYFNTPEWKARVESLRDCGRAQSRIQELEKRLAEIEKKLSQR
jgi:C-terminal processing protease CtpA/Prc